MFEKSINDDDFAWHKSINSNVKNNVCYYFYELYIMSKTIEQPKTKQPNLTKHLIVYLGKKGSDQGRPTFWQYRAIG